MEPSPSVTDEVFAAFLKCRYKAYLKLKGEAGEQSDYLRTQADLADRYRSAARELLLKQAGGVIDNPTSLPNAISCGPALISDATAADADLSCRIDLLENVGGATSAYRPVLFVRREEVTADDRMLLAFAASVLARVQGQAPRTGRIVHGSEFRSRRVELASLVEPVEAAVAQLREMAAAAKAPRLVLNRHCGACEFRNRCRAEAAQKDDLSLLGGLSEKEITKLNARGIYSVTQYSHTFRPRKARKDRPPGAPAPRLPLSLQALAIREATAYVAEKPALPAASVHAYLDVEGLPDEGWHYLIGLVVREGDARRQFSFWADHRQDEARIWHSFLQAVGPLGDFALFHYGGYETDFLQKMGRLHGGDPELLRKIASRSVNVLSLLYSRVFFPVYSNDLKSVASCLGFRWSAGDASGLQAVAWRHDWEATAEEALKQKLLEYNQEDCLALERVVAFLSGLSGDAANGAATGPPVASVEDVRQGSPGRFGRKQYFFPELARITKCSYFDYQRERILFRTSPLLKRYARTKDLERKKKLRPNKVVVSEVPQRCPHCQSESLQANRRCGRLVFDLKLFRGGVKRWVTRYVTRRYKCQTCDRYFTPDDYRSIPPTRYGHNLCAWAVNASICLRQTNEAVADNLADLFGYRLNRNMISEFRKRAAEHYRPTYLAILERLKGGPVIHVDETKASLRGRRKGPGDAEKTGVPRRGRTGFVWAFASPESVFYAYSPSREGQVVRDALAGFRGVVVSDFYTAYDTLDCPQQKCLIHLVRDFNDDLFRHPFDEELKQLGGDFTALLQAVVATIDRFGLKKSHLGKHRKDVDRFFSGLSEAEYRSEVAAYYQKRLTKYRDKLFEFLDHDGVPWNNNNGENAIKRFASLRAVLGTAFSEDGIEDYVVLLSIAQTLRYRDASFWKFLQSGETDLDAFTARSPRRGGQA